MDRPIVYPGQNPLETDNLRLSQYAMVGLAKLSEAMLGTAQVVSGFTLAPTVPASLSAVLGTGIVFQQAQIEATPFSTLPSDSHTIVKEGHLLDPQNLTFVPPTTAGYAQNFLVEVAYQDADSGTTVLPYYNAANPLIGFSGPGGSGAAQNTVRRGAVAYQIKAGVAATAGSQTSPAPDAGWAGLYVVTLAQGQTSITAGNITLYFGAPFIPVTLPGVPNGVQSGQWTYLTISGLNAYTGTLTPTPTTLTANMAVLGFFGTGNTAPAPTVNVSGFGVLPILKQNGGTPAPADLTSFVLLILNASKTAWLINGLVAGDIIPIVAANFIISTGVTIKIGGTNPGASTTGYPNYFGTLAAAFSWVSAYTITATGSVTFNLPAGQTVIANAQVNLNHPNANRIFIAGATMTGALPVPNSFAASGSGASARATDRTANIGSLRGLYGSELNFPGGGGFVFGNGIGSITNTLITGDTGTGVGLGGDLITVQGGTVSLTGVTIGAGGGRGALVTQNGAMVAANSYVFGCLGGGWSIEEGGRFIGSVVIGSFGNGGSNVNVSGGGNFFMDQSAAPGASITSRCSGAADLQVINGNVNCGPSAIFYGGVSGVVATDKSFVQANGAASSAHTNAGFQATDGSTISATGTTSSPTNGTYGYLADVTSNIYATGGTCTGSTAAATPAVNTVGNHNSFITQ